MSRVHATAEPGTLWRHLKTGHLYVVLGRCRLEANWRPAVLYRRVNDTSGILPRDEPIARCMDEFLDGRFEPAFGQDLVNADADRT